MVTSSGGSGFMTGGGPELDTPVPGREDLIAVQQPGGYRTFETKPPAEQAEAEVKFRKRERGRRLIERFLPLVDYVFSLLYGLLGLRLVMGLIAANEQAGFVRFISFITQPFYAPFVDIISSPTMARGKFELPLVMALWVYLLLHLAVRRLPRVLSGASRET